MNCLRTRLNRTALRTIGSGLSAALLVMLSTTPICAQTQATGEIGDFVWRDLNRNGIQDASEPGVSGVNVGLYNGDGSSLIATTSTDGSGLYAFRGLSAATYRVGFTLPVGYGGFTVSQVGSDDTRDSDASSTGDSGPITLSSDGAVDLTIDAGLIVLPTASIGDFVWHDLNRNGLQDPGEPGFPNVLVRLYDKSDLLIATTTTGGDGLYLFSGLIASTYRLQFDRPAGYAFTYTATVPDVTNDSDADSLGNVSVILTTDNTRNTTIDAGLVSIPEPSAPMLLGLGLAGLAAIRKRKQSPTF